MPSYDDDIKLSVGLDINDVTQKSKELSSSIETIFSKASGQKLETNLKRVLSSLNDLDTRARNLRSQMADFANVRIPTDQYKAINDQLDKEKRKIGDLQQRARDFLALGGSTRSTTYKRMSMEYQQLKNSIQQAEQAKLQLEQSGQATFLGSESEEYERMGEQLLSLNNKISLTRMLLAQTSEAGRELVATAWDQITFAFSRIANAAKNVAVHIAKAAKNLLIMVGSKIQSGLKSLVSSMFKLGSSTAKSNDSFKKATRLLLQYGIGVRSMFFLVRRLRRFFSEGITNVATVFSPLKSALADFQGALNNLKNSFGAAFAPILTTVLPILTALINALSTVVTMIGAVFAALKGQTTFLSSKATPAQASFGKATGGSAKAAKELNRQLAGFDDVQILKEDNASGRGGGGGGASEGIGSVLETVPIDSAIGEFAERLRLAFKEQDWELIGEILAEGINKIFQKANELLTDNTLLQKIREITNAIVRTFNSLVDNIDWNLIGTTLGNGVNLVFNTINQLLSGVDWTNLGAKLGEGLDSLFKTINWRSIGAFFTNKFNAVLHLVQGAVENFDWRGNATRLAAGVNQIILEVDWKNLGKTFGESVKGIFGGIAQFIEDVDWYGLGQGLKTALQNVDWSGIISSISETIGAALGGLAEFIWGLIEDAWDSVVDYWKDKIEESGGNIIEGLWNGIKDALLGIGDWIKTNIFDPFIEGFKKAFGISSPSKKMKEQGGFIIDGLLEGMKDAIKDIKKWIQENILDPIGEKLGDFKATIEVGIERARGWAEDAWEAIKVGGQTLYTTLKTSVVKLTSKWIPEAWEAAKMSDNPIVKALVQSVEKAQGASKWVADAWKAAQMGDTTVLKELIQSVKQGVFDTVAWAAAQMNDIPIIKTLVMGVQWAKDNVPEAWTAAQKKKETVERKLVQGIAKATGSNWAQEALAIVQYKKEEITRSLTQKLFKGTGANWNDTAYTVAQWGSGIYERAYSVAMKKKSGDFDMQAYYAATATNKALSVSVRLAYNSKQDRIMAERLGLAKGGVFAGGRLMRIPQFANGGIIANSIRNIPKYASGGMPHGSIFVAGEAGAEIVGNVNGRTEILNKSQMASVMYHAVLAGMATAVNNIGNFLSNKLALCTNSLISSIIYVNKDLQTSVDNVLGRVMNMDTVLSQIGNVTATTFVPAVAEGAVIPYSVKQIDDKLTALTDMLGEMRNKPQMFTLDELTDALDEVLRNRLNISLYMGDEEVARHANAGNARLSRRYNR